MYMTGTLAGEEEACESVIPHADWVVIDRRGIDPAELKNNYPMMRDPQPAETRAFEQTLDSSFEFVTRDGIPELRHRRYSLCCNGG